MKDGAVRKAQSRLEDVEALLAEHPLAGAPDLRQRLAELQRKAGLEAAVVAATREARAAHELILKDELKVGGGPQADADSRGRIARAPTLCHTWPCDVSAVCSAPGSAGSSGAGEVGRVGGADGPPTGPVCCSGRGARHAPLLAEASVHRVLTAGLRAQL